MALERLDSVRSSLSSKVTISSTPEELHPGVTSPGGMGGICFSMGKNGWFFHGENGGFCDFCWEIKKLKKCMKIFS